MQPKRFRSIVRSIHIVSWIGTFICSPWGRDPVFAASLKFRVIFLLGITDIAL